MTIQLIQNVLFYNLFKNIPKGARDVDLFKLYAKRFLLMLWG